jgi:hypothetical protein
MRGFPPDPACPFLPPPPPAADQREDNPLLLQEVRQLPPSSSKDPDQLAPLVAEAVCFDRSVLIFCSARAGCESCAGMLASQLPFFTGQPAPDKVAARQALADDLVALMGGYRNEALERLFRGWPGLGDGGGLPACTLCLAWFTGAWYCCMCDVFTLTMRLC